MASDCLGSPLEIDHDYERFYRNPDLHRLMDVVCKGCGERPNDLFKYMIIPTPAERALLDCFFPPPSADIFDV